MTGIVSSRIVGDILATISAQWSLRAGSTQAPCSCCQVWLPLRHAHHRHARVQRRFYSIELF